MRAISVRQPWAWAIIHGGKNVENRSRNIVGAYRGPVAIHAAMRPDDEALRAFLAVGDRLLPALHYGAVIGVADVLEVHRDGQHRAGCATWGEPGTVHIMLGNPRPAQRIIRCPGALGLWQFDYPIEELCP